MRNSIASDIAVVGGGPVGLCAALALGHDGRNISIIEASQLRVPNEEGLNARSIALSYSSVQIFRALGIWPAIKKRSVPIGHIHVSSRGRWGITRLHASDYDIPALGYVIESQHLVAGLLRAVEASGNISLICEASFEAIDNNQKVEIEFKHQKRTRRISSDLALIADGAGSLARGALGIDHREVDYAQSAIITNVEFSHALPDHAYERFTEQGPLAILPLGGKRYACVWTRDNQAVEVLMQLDDVDFAAELQECFGIRLGYVERIGRRFSFPVRRTEAASLGKGRCLLIGNAANALHPVAGQGFNLALRDIAGLYELMQNRVDLSDLVDAYQRHRQPEQRRVVRLGDGLVNLFSNQLPLLDHARAGGLAMLDLMPMLKTQVAMSGMGFGFGGNALLRGRL
ncbi:MAG: 2-octaprenyl-6-methoxyphenyl hydroxylase [Gammaproteobacteria bacterium]|nr:2-octaprenyl-6-methoxyphenyl hydroxylase [Gammaproteobacteria bacterium]